MEHRKGILVLHKNQELIEYDPQTGKTTVYLIPTTRIHLAVSIGGK